MSNSYKVQVSNMFTPTFLCIKFLCTYRLQYFVTKFTLIAVAELCIERPLKLNLSISKVQQLLGFSDTLLAVVGSSGSLTQSPDEAKLKVTQAKARQGQ